MPENKGFSLMEIIVVVVILGILSAMAIPSYLSYQMQGAAKAAQNNLITIFNTEKMFYLNNTFKVGVGQPAWYCSTSSQNTTCANNLTNINTNLSLNITDIYFSYNCIDPNSGSDGNDGSAFFCEAMNNTDNNFTLTVTGPANPIILTGGTGCQTNAGANCNPRCTYATHPNYCPGIFG